MSNRINGDFDPSSIDAFRAAYAAQILEPEDQETDPYTGLPTELVLNTSPWIQHTGLWKANDGTDKYFQPNQTLVPGEQSFEEEEEDDEEEGMTEDELNALLASLDEKLELEEDVSELTDEELEALVEELLGNSDEGEEDDSEPLSDEEINNMLEELLSEDDSETSYEEDTEDDLEEALNDEEIDALIAELEAELESFDSEEEENDE